MNTTPQAPHGADASLLNLVSGAVGQAQAVHAPGSPTLATTLVAHAVQAADPSVPAKSAEAVQHEEITIEGVIPRAVVPVAGWPAKSGKWTVRIYDVNCLNCTGLVANGEFDCNTQTCFQTSACPAGQVELVEVGLYERVKGLLEDARNRRDAGKLADLAAKVAASHNLSEAQKTELLFP